MANSRFLKEDPVAFRDDDKTPIYGYHPKTGQPICFARLRKGACRACLEKIAADTKPPKGCTDCRRCRKAPARGTGRCALYHNGNSLIGAAHPSTKEVRYANLYPQRYRKYAQQALESSAGLDLTNEIDALDIRHAELVDSLDKRDSAESFKLIEDTYKQLQEARVKGDPDAIDRAITEIGIAITAGASTAVTWENILQVFKEKRQLVSTASRIKAQDASNMNVVTVRDINFRATRVLNDAVISNVAPGFDRLLTEIRLQMLEQRIDVSVADVLLGIFAPLFRTHAEKVQRLILSEAARGMLALLPIEMQRQVMSLVAAQDSLPSGNFTEVNAQ